MGVVHLEAGDLAREFHDEVLAAQESLTHLFHAFLRAAESSHGCHLAHGARAAGVLPLQFVHSLCQSQGCGGETDAPACHGIRLRHAVDHHRALLHVGQGGDGSVRTDVVDVLVNLVADHRDLPVAAQHLGKGFQFRGAVNAARGIAGRAEDKGAGALGDGRFELGGRYLEILLNRGFHEHGLGTCEQHHLRIAHPIGRGDNHFVALGSQCHDGVAHGLLRAVRHRDLRGIVCQAVFAEQLLADGFADSGVAGHGRIAREILVDSFVRGLLDVVGRVEVGLTDGKVYHVHALSFKLCALLRHGQSGRRRKAVYCC